MARNNALNFNLPSVDDLFSTEESRAEARLEKVVNLNPSEISDFPDHPFKVRMDAAMQEMAESVKYYHFVQAESAEQFDEYIAECKELALYDTGVTAEYGDKLICMARTRQAPG